ATDYKQSRYVRFHAYNGLFWGLAVLLVLGLVWFSAVLAGIVGLPGILVWLLYKVRTLVAIGAFIFSILFAVKANNRENVRIPVISDIADKQTG
ncbi:MAG: DUF4870 domain-containing protein, partial [Armatimonadetes bacterium]|nr:DUF4870 domain-containing protein [Armatimonadota bacterium]